jgi:hypothetical protein
MYGKRVFKVLTALFMLSVLVGCGGGGSGDGDGSKGKGLPLNSVDVSTNFPQFTWSGITKVEYVITKMFSKESDIQSVINWFESKYQNRYTYQFSVGHHYNVTNPSSSLTGVEEIWLQAMEANEYYSCALTVVVDPSVTLDENLLEVLFGPTNAPITNIMVTKYLSGNVNSYLQDYGNLLSKSPYSFSGSGFSLSYFKEDYDTNIGHAWTGDPDFAIWNIHFIVYNGE